MHSEPVPAQPDTTGLGLRVQEAKLEHFGLTTNYITVGGHRNVLQFLHSTQTEKKKKSTRLFVNIQGIFTDVESFLTWVCNTS
jgi:hypothetical protein